MAPGFGGNPEVMKAAIRDEWEDLPAANPALLPLARQVIQRHVFEQRLVKLCGFDLFNEHVLELCITRITTRLIAAHSVWANLLWGL